ncbi:MAG: hypothetical protein AAGA03_19550, partial [Planctomycetota bacterium]
GTRTPTRIRIAISQPVLTPTDLASSMELDQTRQATSEYEYDRADELELVDDKATLRSCRCRQHPNTGRGIGWLVTRFKWRCRWIAQSLRYSPAMAC